MRQTVLLALLPIVGLTLIAPSAADAQTPPLQTSITPTTGTGDLGTQISPPAPGGNIYGITGGKSIGTNLFHSFGDFTVKAGDVAQFQTPGPTANPSTTNIIGRVTTSGNPSSIFGTIDSVTYYPTANLFLMNPSGIVLGPGASLDVGGSVSLTTAQYIRLFDGLLGNANFYANPANDGLANSIIVMEPALLLEFLSPAAYGFLTAPNPNATITVQGSDLDVNSISLVGGKVVIQGAQLADGTVQPAKLLAQNGTINLGTAGSPGEFDVNTLQPLPSNPVDPASATSFTSIGSVSLTPGSSIDVHGANTVLIKGGQLVISVKDATLSTAADLKSDTILLGPGSSIFTSNSGTDAGVDVQLTASKLELQGPFTRITAETGGTEHGGNITITADKVEIEGFETGIFSGAGFESSKNGGDINITATSLDLRGGSTILSSTSGNASNGNITVRVHDASLTGGSTLASDTSSLDEGVLGGNITVQGLDGGKAASLLLAGRDSGIRSQTFGQNKLGNILIETETLKMMDGARINAGEPLSSATAGTITIHAGLVNMTGQSRISSSAFNFDAGPIAITAGQLTLDNSRISADTSSSTGGRGGDVILDVGSAHFSNRASITSKADNTGVAGNITISASGSVTMTNGSGITASSTGSGNAGNIRITSGSTFLMQNSSVTTEASQASGGQITINAPDMIRLIDSTISTSVAGGANDSNGGNISIDPDFVILKGSQILAQAVAGTGGAIDITAGLFLADAYSIVDASSTLGVSGTVEINAPINNLGEVIAPLPESLLTVETLLRAACAQRLAQGGASSFVERGRDSIPAGPEGLLASPYVPVASRAVSRPPATPSVGLFGVQLRRIPAKELSPSIMILSENAACSS
jgi:filamentous hemagglutinin family protein